MPVVVGVDAGATSTVAIAAEGERTIRTFAGDPANVRIAGVDGAADTIARSIAASLEGDAAHAIFVGAAGAGNDDVASALAGALRARFPEARIAVSDDAHVALRAGVAQGDGIVLIAGTGSIAYAEIDGTRYRSGGYGYLIGDDGSGFAIGAAAMKLLLRSYDGRVPRDAMLERIETQLGVANRQDAIAAVYEAQHPVTVLASLAAIVLDCASGGERSANKIVQGAALELFELVKNVAQTAGVSGRELPLVFSGGLLRSNSLLSYLLETRLSHDFPFLQPVKNAAAPHVGALALARVLLAAQ
jgi:N-acetylglucosamine kinase-like BadF-type ATPase